MADAVHSSPPVGRLRVILAAVFGIVGLVILVSLGTWQMERLAWKNGIVETIEARTVAPPVPVADLPDGEALDYRPVTVTGRFVNSGERYFLATFKGEAGWNVLTPLLVDGTDTAIFVNRGFVPYARKMPETRFEGQIEGSVEITGLARAAPTAKPGSFLPDNEPETNIFFWKSIPQMSEGLALPAGTRMLPFLIDAGPGSAPGGGPVGGVTVVQVTNNHLQYAITWYGLAAVLAVMLVIFATRWLRGRA